MNILKKILGTDSKTHNYEENRMSPFDAYALKEILNSFERKDLTCLEIGSWFGAGSTQIIGEFAKELVCVDHWKGNENDEHRKIVSTINVFDRFKENTSHFGDIVKPIRGHSEDVCPFLERQIFDFIFIDGDHRYKSTILDILATKALLKPGGILCGHDCEGRITSKNREVIIKNSNCDHIKSVYENFAQCHPGVVRAVDELIDKPHLYADKRLHIEGKGGFSTIWWTRL